MEQPSSRIDAFLYFKTLPSQPEVHLSVGQLVDGQAHYGVTTAEGCSPSLALLQRIIDSNFVDYGPF